MAEQQLDYLKKNWITFANLIVLLTLSFRVGVVLTDLQNSVKDNKEAIEKHERNESIHLDYEKNSRLFVPRTEIDSRLENMSK